MDHLKYILGPFYTQHTERLLQASDAPSCKQAALVLAEYLVRDSDWRGAIRGKGLSEG